MEHSTAGSLGASTPSESCEEDRRKQRESLSAAFADPLAPFASLQMHPALRTVSHELVQERQRLQDRILKVRAVSEKFIGSFSPEIARSFVDERLSLTNDLADHIKESRNKVRVAREQHLLDNPTAKRLLFRMEEEDAALLKERAALARHRAKLEFGILSHATDARIGEAYLAALAESLPDSTGARTEQEQFKRLLRQAYTPMEGSAEYDPPYLDPPHFWCPVTRQWHDTNAVRAAHIVPSAIGEANAAYVFGLAPDEGWKALWDFTNGLLLHARVGQALGAGQLVIVPDDECADEFKLIVLDESILDKTPYGGGPKYSALNNSRLHFKTESRPGKRYLYFRTLITLFRRHRLDVKGSEVDREKLAMGRIWGTPSKWMRGSIIRALALEIGDMLEPELITGRGDLEEIQYVKRASSCKERNIAVDIREALETDPNF